jgi:hypothetical protein
MFNANHRRPEAVTLTGINQHRSITSLSQNQLGTRRGKRAEGAVLGFKIGAASDATRATTGVVDAVKSQLGGVGGIHHVGLSNVKVLSDDIRAVVDIKPLGTIRTNLEVR